MRYANFSLRDSILVFAMCVLIAPSVLAVETNVPGSAAGTWVTVGRAIVVPGADSVTVANGSVANSTQLGDCQFSFKARMPESSEQVQIWGAIRVKDRLNRYVFGLRGGTEAEVSLARYAPDARAKFLGFALLDFKPIP